MFIIPDKAVTGYFGNENVTVNTSCLMPAYFYLHNLKNNIFQDLHCIHLLFFKLTLSMIGPIKIFVYLESFFS